MGSPEADHSMAILGTLTCTAQVNGQILSFITRLCEQKGLNLQAGEIFKIRSGKIHEIEAMGASLPYGTKSGWE
jgi:hypothetical protein